MPLIYGTGFKPIAPAIGETRERRDETNTALLLLERVGIAIAFIALSFIPVAGEAIGAEELVGASALVSESETLSVAASDIIDTALAEGTEVGELASLTANVARLGQTVKGSFGLAVSEAVVNAGVDVQEGNFDAVNEVLNFGLSAIPILGAFRGRRLANVRLTQRADQQIVMQKQLLNTAETVADRLEIETRIRQLENIKLVKTQNIYNANISSDVTAVAKKEILSVVEKNGEDLGGYLKVNQLANDVKASLLRNDIRISKTEAKALVRMNTKNLPSVVENVSIRTIAKTKTFNRVVNALRWADPNLAVRKVWTHTAHYLTTDEAFLSIGGKTIIGGEKINLGYYKKFGQKLAAQWRKWGKKIYKASRVKMIPVISSWIEGYRLVDTPVPGEYVMIVIFKPSKNGRVPQPRIISPVTLETALAFASGEGYGNSPGSFYINRFALARNGSGPNILGGLGSVMGPIPLGELRDILSAPAAFERVVRDFARGDYTQQWVDSIVETTSRLWAHKVGKVLLGRWGIAAARGFQKTKAGHTYLQGNFDWRYLMDEVAVVTLDKSRSVQRKAGIQGRTSVINGRRQLNQYKRTVKLMTFGYAKFDGKTGFKKGNGIF